MSTQLVTPAGTIDLTDTEAAQPKLLGIITTLSAQLAAAQADLQDAAGTAELEKLLRIQEDRAGRLAQRVDALAADKSDRAAERKNLRGRVLDLQKSNDKYRDRIDGMKAELARARGGERPRMSGIGVSDLQIASVMLSDLHDRLTSEARRTPSPAAATGPSTGSSPTPPSPPTAPPSRAPGRASPAVSASKCSAAPATPSRHGSRSQHSASAAATPPGTSKRQGWRHDGP